MKINILQDKNCFREKIADEDEGVKADDIWNKFVSDDQNVVRAPTADSRVTGTASTLRSGSQVTGSQGKTSFLVHSTIIIFDFAYLNPGR